MIDAVACLAALAHDGRLSIYRLLIQAGPEGLTVGEIARRLRIPGPTLSFHLSQLKHAGLARAERDGRRLIQTANYARMNRLIGYLTENCCGDPALCAPVCRPAAEPKKRKAS